MKDLYKILGVDRGSSPAVIKKAYKALAHKYHPDRPDGDEQVFKELKMAYSVLSDPERRARYDQTGTVESAIDNQQAEIIGEVANLFMSILSRVGDPDYVDIANEMLKEIKNGEDSTRDSMAKNSRQARKFAKMIDRVTYRENDDPAANYLVDTLNKQLESIRQHNHMGEQHLNKLARMKAEIHKFKFKEPSMKPDDFGAIACALNSLNSRTGL